MIYLDNAATTMLHPEVLKTYEYLLEHYFANPSSIHALGVKANQLMQQSREQIAALLKVNSSELTFTASASEANNLAIKGYVFAHMKHGRHLICSKVEHSSVYEVFKQLESEFGFQVTYLDVNHEGVVEPETLKKAMKDDTILVACMYVNNEVGSINDIQALAKIAHQNIHCAFLADCVQALGKIPISLKDIDLASFSAHKIHGLKGSGVLYHRKNLKLMPLIVGGDQEHGLRAGTSNVLTNITFAKTLRLAMESQAHNFQNAKHLNRLVREKFADFDEVSFLSPKSGSPYILSMAIKVLGSEIIMNALQNKQIYVSAKSTCQSSYKGHSKVLMAMKCTEEEMNGVIRISFTSTTSEEEVLVFIRTLEEIIHEYRTK